MSIASVSLSIFKWSKQWADRFVEECMPSIPELDFAPPRRAERVEINAQVAEVVIVEEI